MSRYIRVACPKLELHDLLGALEEKGIEYTHLGKRVALEGSLECVGEPVDIRIPAGVLGAVEDFGFLLDGDRVVLVCGELDEARLRAALLDPIVDTLITNAVTRSALDADLELDDVDIDARGRRVITLRPRSSDA